MATPCRAAKKSPGQVVKGSLSGKRGHRTNAQLLGFGAWVFNTNRLVVTMVSSQPTQFTTCKPSDNLLAKLDLQALLLHPTPSLANTGSAGAQ